MAKTPEQLNLKPVRSHPADIIKGFTDLGYDAPEIDRQFDFHKADLQDDDDSREYSDDDVYQYMRDHLADKGILPNVDESIDHYRARLGREPSNEEYRNWIKPKIKRSYKEFVDSGYDPEHIRSELKDAYYYDDLIDEAMGIKRNQLGSKSRFAQKYPDRFANIKARNSNIYGKGRTYEDVDWDAIAEMLGVEL